MVVLAVGVEALHVLGGGRPSKRSWCLARIGTSQAICIIMGDERVTHMGACMTHNDTIKHIHVWVVVLL